MFELFPNPFFNITRPFRRGQASVSIFFSNVSINPLVPGYLNVVLTLLSSIRGNVAFLFFTGNEHLCLPATKRIQ